VALVAVYLIACVCRTILPELGWRITTSLFVIRVACVGLGLVGAYGFMWFCMHEPHIVRNPDVARIYMFSMVGVSVAVGEFLARRYLRTKGIFDKKKHIPWVY